MYFESIICLVSVLVKIQESDLLQKSIDNDLEKL